MSRKWVLLARGLSLLVLSARRGAFWFVRACGSMLSIKQNLDGNLRGGGGAWLTT